MSGLKLLRTLSDQGHALPVIVVAGPGEVRTAVDALKAGVVDFLEKPIERDVLLASVERALVRGRESEQLKFDHETAANRLLELTPRQRQVMNLILAGHPSKIIAADIGVSQRTVESHRAEVMRKTGARSMPALAPFGAAAAVRAVAPLRFDFGRPTVIHSDRGCCVLGAKANRAITMKAFVYVGVETVQSGKIDLTRLITHHLKLDQILDAYDTSAGRSRQGAEGHHRRLNTTDAGPTDRSQMAKQAGLHSPPYHGRDRRGGGG